MKKAISENPLFNKNILFFSPSFFSYEDRIKAAFERAGASVTYYDERSVTSPISKALLKVFPNLFNKKTLKYYKNIINSYKNAVFDYILIVRCDMVTPKIISLLRQNYPKAKICLHLWDSMKNVKGIKKKLQLFDFVSSFDMDDCKNNPSVFFRPLFYSEEFENSSLEKKYDLCFCGTIHSDRYCVLKKIMNEASNIGLKTFVFAYLPSKFMYTYYKFTAKGFKDAHKSDFSFAKKSISDISKIEKESKVIIDIQHPKQTGLTMRTIEMIGAGVKFITTNKDVVNYDFYNPNNIMVIDRNNPNLQIEFFRNAYEPIDNEIYKKYSINRWVMDVLGVCL